MSTTSSRIQSRIARLSLRGRLGIIFIGLMLCAIGIAVTLILQQHRMALKGTAIAIQTQEAMSAAYQVRETLSDLNFQVRLGKPSQEEVGRFRYWLQVLEAHSLSSESKVLVKRIKQAFDLYLKEVSNIHGISGGLESDLILRAQYGNIRKAVSDWIELNQRSVSSLAESLHDQEHHSMELAFLLICAFLLLVCVISFRIASLITNPILGLVKFIDDVNVENELPIALPPFGIEAPETELVVNSFEKLLQRLRGYRAINVKKLLFEKRRADIIAASISDGIFLLRGDQVLYVNPTAEKILGFQDGGPPQGLRLSDPSECQNPGMVAIMKAVSCSMPVEFVLEVDERKYYYLIQSSPIAYDLIEQEEFSVDGSAEQSLEKLKASSLVLAQDVTLVRESQEAKSHFLATLSHEVKTPVTSLTMATRLLKKTVDQIPNPTQRSLIVTCAEDVDRLRGLLDDLMTISRFDTLTQRLEIQNIDLGKLLLHSVQSFQLQAKERGIELVHQIAGHKKPIIVSMDATKIAWALSNLLTNALRHTPRGGRVEARVAAFEERVEVKIHDSGPGIERHRKERIFDKFNPYYDLRVARSGSAGVGLAIAREIVVAHGGRIWVSSEPGQGAEFCFTLPLNRSVDRSSLEDAVQKPIIHSMKVKEY